MPLTRAKAFFFQNKFFVLFLVTWIVLLSGLRTLQHYSFWTNAHDLSLFDYGIAYTLKGEIMADPFHKFDFARWMSDDEFLMFEDARSPSWESHFAVHFTPIVFFIVPLYAIFNGPLFLLLLQVFVVGISAVPLYLIAKNIYRGTLIPNVIIVIYLSFRHLVIGLMHDIHFEMAFPLFLFSCYYFAVVKKNPALYYVSLGLALFIKEDIAIYMFCFGLFLIFKKTSRKTGIITAAICLSYLVLALYVVIPFFRAQAGLPGSYAYQHVWAYLGEGHGEVLWNLLTHPWRIFEGVPLLTVVRKFGDIILPLLLLPLFSSLSLLIAPPLLVAIMSKIPQNYTFGMHYSATLLPFVFLAFAEGLRNLKRALSPEKGAGRKRIFLALLVLLLVVGLGNSNLWKWLDPGRYRAIKDYRVVQGLIRQIPAAASVAALSSLVPHIPKRKMIYMLPETGGAEYLLIHSGVNLWPFQEKDFLRFVEALESNKKYRCLEKNGQAALYRKIGGSSYDPCP